MNQVAEGVVLEREVQSAPHDLPQVAQAAGLPAGQTQPSDLLAVISRVASDPNVDIAKVERLFAMHKDMMALQAKAAYNAAMSRAQAKILPIVTNAENDHTNSRYATLAAINKAIVPIYSAEGLAVSFDTETVNAADPIPQGHMRTVAFITHSEGHTERRHIDLPPDATGAQGKVNKTGVQAAGSTNEYSRRYLMRMIFNISTYDDTDGSGEVGGRAKGPVPDEAGKKILEACASADSLKKAWGALTKEQRATLNEVMAECRRKIAAADQS